MFWIDYNASGAASIVANAFNGKLWSNTSVALPLFSLDSASFSAFSAPTQEIAIPSSYGRRLLMQVLEDINEAVPALRRQTVFQSMRSATGLCWLDFDKQWEVGGTSKRQVRCRRDYADNAAVYMEAILRNVNWADWYNAYGPLFEICYGAAVRAEVVGTAWLARTTTALAVTPVAQEIEHWRTHGIRRYTVSWHNSYHPAVQDTILIRTPLQAFSVPIKSLTFTYLTSLQSSSIAFCGVYFQMAFSAGQNFSLVLNASNTQANLVPWDPPSNFGNESDAGLAYNAFFDAIGPSYNMDLTYILPPTPLLEVYGNIKAAWHRQKTQDAATASFLLAMPTQTDFDMIPSSWRQMANGSAAVFFGGNPLCVYQPGTPYPQQMFGFDDGCTAVVPLGSTATPDTLVLAWLLSSIFQPTVPTVTEVCAFTQDLVAACSTVVQLAATIAQKVSPVAVLSQRVDPTTLNISIVQYVNSSNDKVALIRQPILDLQDAAWSFYGWLAIADWLEGSREVVMFTGDAGSIPLMSKAYAPLTFTSPTEGIPTEAASLLRAMYLYFDLHFFAVAALMAVAWVVSIPTLSLKQRLVAGRNLCFTMRVGSLVWVGRPLLLLRGVFASVVLSTASVALKHSLSHSHLAFEPRSALDSFLLAGEATWLTFVINDLASIFTAEHTKRTNVISCLLVWFGVWILELASPVMPLGTFDRSCTSTNMDAAVVCSSGAVDIGSRLRLSLLLGIQVTTVLAVWLVVRTTTAPMVTGRRPAPVFVPAVAQTLLENLPPVHDADISIYLYDPIGAVAAGLLPYRRRGVEYVFSGSLWTAVAVQQSAGPSRLASVFALPVFSRRVSGSSPPLALIARSQQAPSFRFRACLGALYLMGTVVSSVLFLYSSQTQLANDFLRMQLYNETTTAVATSPLYAHLMQFEALGLEATIRGLRASDGCRLPLVFTQYCWLDFGRRWSLAHSTARSRRCSGMTANAAVYLEAGLRNADWDALSLCSWFGSLQTSILRALDSTNDGVAWTAATAAAMKSTSVTAEAGVWRSHGLDTYSVQWQNYKLLGVLETISITNVFGVASSITIKASVASELLAPRNSLVMYPGFAFDLWAVSNASALPTAGKSLVSSSADFAFANVTSQALLIANGTLTSPIPDGLALVTADIGPFGTVDMVHVPCPLSLLQVVATASTVISSTLVKTKGSAE
ncbi:hypothetical protein ACHHYP_06531, partial [Achlya hypogyna]